MVLAGVPSYEEVKDFARLLLLVQARLMPMFILLPFMSRSMVPRTFGFAFAAGVGLIVVPMLPPASTLPTDLMLVVLLAKEAIIGLVLGYLVAIPFWVFEAIGFVVDNHRGASMAATINPMTGSDSSPLGLLMNFTFITFFMVVGGMPIFLGLIYDSYKLWNPFDFWPAWGEGSSELLIVQLNKMVLQCLLLASPIMIAMLLAELGLALVSRFAPQLQVFFLAMPIKSALGIFVLIVYASTMLDFGLQPLHEIGTWVQRLDPLLRPGTLP